MTTQANVRAETKLNQVLHEEATIRTVREQMANGELNPLTVSLLGKTAARAHKFALIAFDLHTTTSEMTRRGALLRNGISLETGRITPTNHIRSVLLPADLEPRIALPDLSVAGGNIGEFFVGTVDAAKGPQPLDAAQAQELGMLMLFSSRLGDHT